MRTHATNRPTTSTRNSELATARKRRHLTLLWRAGNQRAGSSACTTCAATWYFEITLTRQALDATPTPTPTSATATATTGLPRRHDRDGTSAFAGRELSV